MTLVAGRLEHATLSGAALAPPFARARTPIVRSRFLRAAAVAGDVVGAGALVLCIPFVILAIGIPAALAVRLLLWLGTLL